MKNINPENNHGQPPLHLAAKLTSVVFEKPLGFIFEKPSMRNNRSKYSDKLCQPVPGHPEITSNKMAQIWNNLKLNMLSLLLVLEHLLLIGIGKSKKLTNVIFYSVLFLFLLN